MSYEIKEKQCLKTTKKFYLKYKYCLSFEHMKLLKNQAMKEKSLKPQFYDIKTDGLHLNACYLKLRIETFCIYHTPINEI